MSALDLRLRRGLASAAGALRSARTRRAPALVMSPRTGRAAAGSRLLRLLGLVTPPATSLSIFAGIALPVGALAPLDGLLWWSILRLTYRPAVKMVRTRVKARTNMSSWMWYPVSRAVWCEHRAECCSGIRNASGSPDSWSILGTESRLPDVGTSPLRRNRRSPAPRCLDWRCGFAPITQLSSRVRVHRVGPRATARGGRWRCAPPTMRPRRRGSPRFW